MYLVDRARIALPMEALYSSAIMQLQVDESAAAGAADPALPLSPDGTLVAGQLYTSSADAGVSYYLPTYQVRMQGGLYQASLKWTPDASDPSQPIGMLTIDLEAQAPSAAGARLQEIPHQAVVRLRCRLPENAATQNDTPDTTDPANLPPFVMEIGALTPLAGVPNVRRCQLAVPTKQVFDRIYEIMTDRAFGGVLEIRCFAVVGRRTWRQVVIDESPGSDELPPWGGHRGTWGTLPPVRFEPPIRPDLPGRFDPPGRFPNPRQRIGILSEEPAQPSAPEEMFQLVPAELKNAPEGPLTLGDDSIFATRVNASQLGLFSTRAAPVTSPVVAAPIASPLVGVLLPVGRAASPPVLQPDVQVAIRPLAESLASSDLMINDGTGFRRGIPVGAYVNRDRVPVLLQVPVEARQSMPFFFRADVNGYMFDVPAGFTPTISSRLERQTFTMPYNTDVINATFYHDLGLGTYYYQPTEFRLARTARGLDQAAYHPYLTAALQDIVTQEDGGAAKTTCQVNLSYQALPYIDPIILAMAANAFGQSEGKQIDFAPLQPVVAPKLTLHLPSPGGATVDLPRPDVSINFDAGAGFADVLTLPYEQFQPILAALTNNLPIGGTVDVQLLNNIHISVPLRLSLKDTAGALFDPTFNGAVAGSRDQYAVTLANRVESPVRIERLDPVMLGPGQIASPNAGQEKLTVDVGQSQQIIYTAKPEGTAVARIDPILVGSVALNAELVRALWQMLLINQGYSSTSFPVNVQFDSAFPWAQRDGTALTGLRVDFDCNASVKLEPGAPKQTATLQQGYLAMVLGAWQSYRYRVTNLLASGDGAQSDWQDGAGDLTVQPA